MFPTNSQTSTVVNNSSNNLLDDLDPFKTTNHLNLSTGQRPSMGLGPPNPVPHNPIPPMAPPRTKKSVSQNWTTFD